MEEHISKGNYSTEVEKYNSTKEKDSQKPQNKHTDDPKKDNDSKINIDSKTIINKNLLSLEDLNVQKGNWSVM